MGLQKLDLTLRLNHHYQLKVGWEESKHQLWLRSSVKGQKWKRLLQKLIFGPPSGTAQGTQTPLHL